MGTTHNPHAGLLPGDHVCAVEGDPLTDFVTDGLLYGDRIAYIGAESARDVLCHALHRQGHDVALLARSGRLVLLDSDAVYGPPGTFDGPATVAGFEVQAAAARQDGYRTLRSAGGPSPEMLATIDLGDLVAYELDCDRMAARKGIVAVCEYPPGEEDLVRHVAVAHNRRLVPTLLDPGFGVDVRTDGDLRIIGEVDAFAAGELGIGLAGVVRLGLPVDRVDLSELHFVDSAAMRALGRWLASMAAPDPVEVVGASEVFRQTWELMELGPVTWAGLAA